MREKDECVSVCIHFLQQSTMVIESAFRNEYKKERESHGEVTIHSKLLDTKLQIILLSLSLSPSIQLNFIA